MPKTITITLDPKSINSAVQKVQAYRQKIAEREALFVEKLAEAGLQVANARFSSALYAGTNDVSCRVESNGSRATLYADGQSVGFIEFGTGVAHSAYPPGTDYTPPPHGSYGKGKGKRKKWGYYGDPGNIGEVRTNRKGREVVITSGNEPALAMYGAIQIMQEKINEIARSVFASD